MGMENPRQTWCGCPNDKPGGKTLEIFLHEKIQGRIGIALTRDGR